jgi:hypothetical protein
MSSELKVNGEFLPLAYPESRLIMYIRPDLALRVTPSMRLPKVELSVGEGVILDSGLSGESCWPVWKAKFTSFKSAGSFIRRPSPSIAIGLPVPSSPGKLVVKISSGVSAPVENRPGVEVTKLPSLTGMFASVRSDDREGLGSSLELHESYP